MAGGRPSKYTPEYLNVVRGMAKLGATEVEIASALGVAVSTVSLWKVQHQEFSDALSSSKEVADAKVVESLYRRAVGYSVTETDIRVVEGKIVQTPITKHYPPDATSMIFWLKNRDKTNWRDKVDHAHTGEDGGPISVSHTITFVKPE